MKISYLLLGLVILLASGLVGYNEYVKRGIDENWRADVELNMSDLQALNAKINEEALLSRHDLKNYDRLMDLMGALKKRLSELEMQLSPSAEEDIGLRMALNNLEKGVETKEDILESFKSHNSLLRNSAKFAPIAGQNLREVAEAQGLSEDVAVLEQAVRALLSYALAGDPSDAEAVDESLRLLRDLDARIPDSSRVVLLEFLNHGKTVLEEKNVTDDYLNNLIAVPVQEELNGLSGAFTGYIDKRHTEMQKFRWYAMAFVALLFALIGYLIFKLGALYRSLDRKVQSRTAEIKSAYDSLKKSQNQLIQSEKMASLGKMVAGVAHEISTPLGYVENNVVVVDRNVSEFLPLLDSLKKMDYEITRKPVNSNNVVNLIKTMVVEHRRLSAMDVVGVTKSLLKDTQYGVEQIGKLVKSLLELSYTDRNENVMANINDNLKDALRLCKVHVKENDVKVTTQLAAVRDISCAPSRITQMFMNIITNAAQAIGAGGGSLTIKSLEDRNGNIKVTFEDTGSGIEEEDLNKIFDPFFTTKDIGEGTGLGLSIAYRIARSHGGDIVVKSVPGEGSKFTVILPGNGSSGKAPHAER